MIKSYEILTILTLVMEKLPADEDQVYLLKILSVNYILLWLNFQYIVIAIAYNTYNISEGIYTQIAKFMGPTWGPPGSCQPQMGPMLAPWNLLSVYVCQLEWYPTWCTILHGLVNNNNTTMIFWPHCLHIKCITLTKQSAFLDIECLFECLVVFVCTVTYIHMFVCAFLLIIAP